MSNESNEEIMQRCSFCSAELADVVKLIPKCRSAVCGECYSRLTEELNESGRFDCKACNEHHSAPVDVFGDNSMALMSDETLCYEEKPKLRLVTGEMDSDCEGGSRVLISLSASDCNQSADFPPIAESTRINASQDYERPSGLKRRDSYTMLSSISSDSETGRAVKIRRRMSRSQAFDLSDTCHPNSEDTPLRTLLGHTDFVNQVIFLPDNVLVSCSSDAIKAWSSENGEMIFELRGHTGPVRALVHLSKRCLASGSYDKTIKIWSLDEKMLVKTLQGHKQCVFSLLASPSDNVLISCSRDNTIKLWHPFVREGNLLRTIVGHDITCFNLGLGRLLDGKLVTCSGKKSTSDVSVIRIWEPRTGECVRSFSTGIDYARSLTVLADDRIAVGFQNGTIKIFDAADESRHLTLAGGHEDGGVWSLLQLADGSLLSAGSEKDATVKTWSAGDFKLLRTLWTQHSGDILSLSASKDGRLLASASEDHSIKLWPIN